MPQAQGHGGSRPTSQDPICQFFQACPSISYLSGVDLSEARSLSIVSFQAVLQRSWAAVVELDYGAVIPRECSHLWTRAASSRSETSTPILLRSKQMASPGVGPCEHAHSSNEAVGSGWSGGPEAVVVVTDRQLVFGAVATTSVPFAAPSRRGESTACLLQPFLNVNLDGVVYPGVVAGDHRNWQNCDQQGQ